MRSFKISVVRFLTVLAAMLMLGTSTFAQVSVTLPTVSGLPGTTGEGAITVGDLTGKNVTAFEFTISYDKSIFYITGATAGSLLGSNAPTVNADTANGKILVAWASATALTGSGTLVNLQFKYKTTGSQVLTASPFIFNAGSPTATIVDGEVKVPSVLVQGGSISAVTGKDILIPVMVTEITSTQNVISYNFEATYNSSLITISGVELAGTLSEGGTTSINPTTGNVKFAWASASKIVTTGDTLLYLKGKTLTTTGTAKVEFASFLFNSGTPIASASAAQVVIGQANVAPTLTLSPAQSLYTVNEGVALNITLVGADANTGDVLTYSFAGGVGAAISPAGKFSWTPDYTQGRSAPYSVKFTVTDKAGLSASVTVAVKVNNVNRAPQFTSEIPSGETVTVHIAPNPVPYEFAFAAEDADGDALTFSLIAAPTGSSITSDGHFSWVATSDQAGKSFVVTVEVTDGSLTATSTQVVKVNETIVGVKEEEGVPSEYTLMQNYPNPFNPSTSIRFGIPTESHVKLTVFNILGQEIAVLVDREMSAGYHKVNFNASKLNTGMYMYKIEASNFVSVKKMLLVK